MIRTVPPEVARAANSEVRKVTSVPLNQAIAGGVLAAGVLAFAAVGLGFQPGTHGEDFSSGGGWTALLLAWVLVVTVAAAAVFGALTTGSEYKHAGTALAALFTPDRNLLLATKLAVPGAFALVTVLVMELFGGAAMMLLGRSRVPVDAGFFAVLTGAALAALCWAVIGAALGVVLRSPAQAVAAVLGWAILEPLLWVITRAMGFGGIANLLPVSATVGAMSNGRFGDSGYIAPTPVAMALLLLWTAGAGAGAWWLFTNRDL